jgi:hypothetical protein
VIGVVLIFLQKGQKARAGYMRLVETSTCADLAQACQDAAGEIGAGSFRMDAEVKGTIEAAQDLRSEIRGEPCIYYHTRVEREYEEEDWETDSEGHRKRVTRRGSETMSDTERREKFYVRDATGRLLVNPEGASLEPMEIVDEFQQGDPGEGGGMIRLGRFSLSLGTMLERRRTLGYRYKEWIVPINRQVYVLGQATDSNGELCLERPTEGGKPFIISLKSEEQLLAGAQSSAQWMGIAAGVLLAAGAVLLAVGLIMGAAR